jgi:hypothetical protein
MNHKLHAGSVAATALAASAAGVFAQSATASTSQSFKLTAKAVSGTNIDQGKTGFSTGDYEVHADSLWQSGKQIGWDAGTCLTNRVGGHTADQICTFILHLSHGQIVATGVVRSTESGPGTFTIAITGGTGRYDDARGSLSVTATDSNTVPMTVNVRY